MGVDDKHTYLLNTKLLKNGNLVLVEFVTVCGDVNVKLIKPNGDEESIFTSEFSKFRTFNELPNNNWVLVLVTNATIDVPEPDIIHTIAFIEDDYEINSMSGDDLSIPLGDLQFSAVINSNELVLATANEVFFTDFQFESVTYAPLLNNLQLLKAPQPEGSFLYFKYSNEDSVKTTEDKFQSDQVIGFNFGPEFRDIHYLGDYIIIQDEEEISATFGIFSFEYIEQGKTIYDFSQHGQNLKYYTLSEDSILTFCKLYLDENTVLRKEKVDIDVNGKSALPDLYWDGNFVGISYNTIPLPRTMYDDQYQSHNYILDYNLQNTNLSTQSIDVSIDTIQYEVTNLFFHSFDINLQITISNKSDQEVNGLSLISNGFSRN